MKILFCSHVFAPSIGGIETVGRILAEEFSRAGSSVTVVTNTHGSEDCQAYKVVRRPSLRQLRELACNTDVVFQNNISLKTLLPLLPARKPVVVVHHGCVTRPDGRRGWQEYLKLALLPLCHNIAVSESVASALPVKTVVIGNPFEAEKFAPFRETPRTKDIVFLGRLVSDKGCDLVLRALRLLKDEGISPSLTIIGDGTDMPVLKRLADELGILEQVKFQGAMGGGRGREVAQHKIIVIPSTWAEPFGLVALEGIAAGCVPVASRAGGLPEAVGPCGMLFANGDVNALAAALKSLLASDSLRAELMAGSDRHLEHFQPERVAKEYLQLLHSVCRR